MSVRGRAAWRCGQLADVNGGGRDNGRGLATDGDLLKGGTGFVAIADFDSGAGPVGHAGGRIDGDLGAVLGGGCDGQAAASGRLGAFEAVLADVFADIDVLFDRQEAPFFGDRALVRPLAAVVGDAAFLVGDDDFDAVAEQGFADEGVVVLALGRVHAGDKGRRVAG